MKISGVLVVAVISAVTLSVCDCLAQPTAKDERCLALELYVRPSEKLGVEAEQAIGRWAAAREGVRVVVYDLDANPAATKRLDAIAAYFHLERPPVPLVYGGGQYLAGVHDANSLVENIPSLLRMDVYVRQGCPRCAAAKAYLPALRARYPGLEVRLFDVGASAAARLEMQSLADRYRQAAVSVPVFHVCNRLVVGFEGDTTKRRLESILSAWSFPAPPNDNGSQNQGRQSPDKVKRSSSGKSSWRPTMRARIVFVGFNPDPRPEDGLLLPVDTSTAPPPLPLDQPAGDSDTVEVPWLGRLSASRLGLPLFTVAIGLVDGFNPCAMWVLLFLLSVLVNLGSRAKILSVAGTFVLISGCVYFAFMAAWLNVLVFVGLLRWVQATLATLAIGIGTIHIKDFFAFKQGITLSIPESAKPGIYARVRRIVLAENLTGAILGASVLALLVNLIELLCTAGLPAVYTQVLTLQGLPLWKNYAYLALYNVAYMFDDGIMVALVVLTLGRRKMQERHGRWLKLLSGVVILALGLVMLVRPEWLA